MSKWIDSNEPDEARPGWLDLGSLRFHMKDSFMSGLMWGWIGGSVVTCVGICIASQVW